jgi:hypothetical protein
MGRNNAQKMQKHKKQKAKHTKQESKHKKNKFQNIKQLIRAQKGAKVVKQTAIRQDIL